MAERGSIFARLVVAMLTMAVCLLILVTAFFWFSVGPNFNALVFRLAEEYSRSFASSSPDLAAARRLTQRLDLGIRYDGPEGSWATSTDLPTAGDVRAGRVGDTHLLLGPKYYVAPAPSGGTYLFAWKFSEHVQVAHATLLLLLLVVILAVVFTTHAVLRRLLRPLHVLSDGVARLSEGQLDVRLPNGTRDEFGRLTTAFNTMVGRVREMVWTRDQLLVDVSHELRSPLTRMKVALELPAGTEQRARLTEDITEMERMVEELLELERLRSGRGLSLVRQDPRAIIRDVAETCSDGQPGVRIVPQAREVLIDIDADRIRTVLRNILDNAVKYSRAHSRPIEIAAADHGDTVTIRVTDDGVGIPDSEIERVFEPFYRVDASRSKKTGGYGLGLSICKRIMEAHGGSIAVERPPAGGTSVVLTFVRARP